jgi:hypothetical protein
MVDEQLAELGVRTNLLTAEERERLDTDGFCNLGRLLSCADIETMRERIAVLIAEREATDGPEQWEAAGAYHLGGVADLGPEFDISWTHPRLLTAVAHVLDGQVRHAGVNFRSPLPGHGHQQLHVDFLADATDAERHLESMRTRRFLGCNTFWLLDEATPDSGPTRVVPGSHVGGTLPLDRVDSHPDEVTLTGRPGEVIVMNAQIWHGGSLNSSGAPRRM